MKIFKLISRVFVVASAIGATGYLTQKTVNYVRRIDNYSVTITGNITEQVRENIAQYVQNSWPESQDSFGALCAAVQEQFGCIKDLDIALLPGKKAHVEITTHEPLYLVNNDLLVTRDGVLLAKSVYEPRAIANLYSIQISQLQVPINSSSSFQARSQLQSQLSAACKQSIAQITPQLLEQYLFSWHNDNAAWLQDKSQKPIAHEFTNSTEKNNTQFTILFHPLSIPPATLIQQCNLLKQELEEKIGKKQHDKMWVADVRFKDQIVVSASNKRGELVTQ